MSDYPYTEKEYLKQKKLSNERRQLIDNYSDKDIVSLLKLLKYLKKTKECYYLNTYKQKDWKDFLIPYINFEIRNKLLMEIFGEKHNFEISNISLINDRVNFPNNKSLEYFFKDRQNDYSNFFKFIEPFILDCKYDMNSENYDMNSEFKGLKEVENNEGLKNNEVENNEDKSDNSRDRNDFGIESHDISDKNGGGANKKRTRRNKNKNKKIKRKRKTARKTRIH